MASNKVEVKIDSMTWLCVERMDVFRLAVGFGAYGVNGRYQYLKTMELLRKHYAMYLPTTRQWIVTSDNEGRFLKLLAGLGKIFGELLPLPIANDQDRTNRPKNPFNKTKKSVKRKLIHKGLSSSH